MDQDHDPNGVGDVQEPDIPEFDQIRDDLDAGPGAEVEPRVDEPDPRPIDDGRDDDRDGPGRGGDDDPLDRDPRDRPDRGRPGPEPAEPRPRPVGERPPASIPEPVKPTPDVDRDLDADVPDAPAPAPRAGEPPHEIRLDGPDDPLAGLAAAEHAPGADGEIRLDHDTVEADGPVLGDEAPTDDLDDLQAEDVLPFGGDDQLDAEAFSPAPDNGWLTPALLATAAGTAVAAALSAPLARSGNRLASRNAAAALEEHGIDARVEHGSLDRLEAWLTSTTDEVMVSVHSAGRSPQVCSIVSIDRDGGVVVVEEPGPLGMRLDVRLDEFERSWADTANEVLVTDGNGRQVRLLPVTLGDRSLVAPGW